MDTWLSTAGPPARTAGPARSWLSGTPRLAAAAKPASTKARVRARDAQGYVQAAQKAGAFTQHQIAQALEARGVRTPPGRNALGARPVGAGRFFPRTREFKGRFYSFWKDLGPAYAIGHGGEAPLRDVPRKADLAVPASRLGLTVYGFKANA